tara:strand:+ start:753 stop:923 length:171 start_codon:yes stop_codon:yes gene_type:complete
MGQLEIESTHNRYVIEKFINHLIEIGVINNKKHLSKYADKFIKENHIQFIGGRWEY